MYQLVCINIGSLFSCIYLYTSELGIHCTNYVFTYASIIESNIYRYIKDLCVFPNVLSLNLLIGFEMSCHL